MNPKLQTGNLIRTKKSPSDFDAPDRSGLFFCEQDGMTHEISHGTIGLIINIDRVSAIGNPIVDILFSDENKILSTAHYDDQHGNPLWCNILQ
jgi:hypothetical protein